MDACPKVPNSFPWDMHLGRALEPVGHKFEPQKDLGTPVQNINIILGP